MLYMFPTSCGVTTWLMLCRVGGVPVYSLRVLRSACPPPPGVGSALCTMYGDHAHSLSWGAAGEGLDDPQIDRDLSARGAAPLGLFEARCDD